ncbi:MAG: hypothetical protein ACTHU0_15755 [Kofleriaceae bacterium]
MAMEMALLDELVRSEDHERFTSVARMIGRMLATDPSSEWRATVRKRLLHGQRTRSSEADRAFLAALELVVTGFERERSDAETTAAELRRITGRSHWVAILHALAAGPLLPKDLADKVGLSTSRLTQIMNEMEGEPNELLARSVEGRTRPCRLTARARALLPSLPEAAPVDKQLGAEEVVPAVVRCMAVMARDGRIGLQRLADTMAAESVEPTSAAHLAELLDRSLRENLLAVREQDGALVATETELQSRLDRTIEAAFRDDSPALITKLREIASTGDVVLRVGARAPWEVLLSRYRLDNVRIVRDSDLRFSQVPALDPGYRLIYESPALFAADRDDPWMQPRMQAMIDNADLRYCFGVTPMPPMANFLSISVDP